MFYGVLDERLDDVLRIGLTGGMGAGKSTVSKVLAACGAVIVDSDVIAREVVEPGSPGLAAVVDAFGEDVLQADGRLDRPALAAKAFGSDESRMKLNSIVHPLVGKRTAELIDSAAPNAIVVQDIPLLVENSLGPLFNLVIVVFLDAEERVRRLVAHRDIPEADARARIAAQADDEQRRAAADVRLDNSGPPGSIDAEVLALWESRLAPFEENVRTSTAAGGKPTLVAADPEWPEQAQRLIARLRMTCGASALRIDHIGSTAVRGLDSKDVIDLQITVRDIDAADALAEPLSQGGFPLLDGITTDSPKPLPGSTDVDPSLWVERFHGSADPGRLANIHLRIDGGPAEQFAVVFRDWLRANAEVRDEYLEIKRRAAETAQSDLDAYVDAKEPWFDAAYERAWKWKLGAS